MTKSRSRSIPLSKASKKAGAKWLMCNATTTAKEARRLEKIFVESIDPKRIKEATAIVRVHSKGPLTRKQKRILVQISETAMRPNHRRASRVTTIRRMVDSNKTSKHTERTCDESIIGQQPKKLPRSCTMPIVT